MQLTRLIALVIFVLSIGSAPSCSRIEPTGVAEKSQSESTSIVKHEARPAATHEPELIVQCRLLSLREDFFGIFGNTLPKGENDICVLTKMETFFLFQSKHQVKQAWNRITPETKTSIHDNVATDGDEYIVDISWRRNNDLANHEIAISTPVSSKFNLRKTENVTIPNGGSLILRTANAAINGKTRFLWIIARHNTDNDSK